MKKTYEIYQIQDANNPKLFLPYELLNKRGLKPDISEYTKVYEAPLNKNSLEDIFRLLNEDNRPNRTTSRSLSVSDIILIKEENKTTMWYVDIFGFKEIT